MRRVTNRVRVVPNVKLVLVPLGDLFSKVAALYLGLASALERKSKFKKDPDAQSVPAAACFSGLRREHVDRGPSEIDNDRLAKWLIFTLYSKYSKVVMSGVLVPGSLLMISYLGQVRVDYVLRVQVRI